VTEELACIHVQLCDAIHLVVKASFLDLGDKDVVGLSGDLNTLFGTVAEDTDGDSRTGEGVSVDEGFVDTELTTNCLL
jgi:hypothetical protein